MCELDTLGAGATVMGSVGLYMKVVLPADCGLSLRIGWPGRGSLSLGLQGPKCQSVKDRETEDNSKVGPAMHGCQLHRDRT